MQAREAGQWAIGTALGLYFSAPVLAVLARHLGWILLAVSFAICLGMAGGALLRRVGRETGVLPLFDLRPDPQRPGVAFAHDGPVTGLIDADMKPLAGPIDRETGKPRGLPVQERPGGPVVHRTITTGERAEICAALFTLRWRAAGCRRVTAIRPPMGQDFNDMAREVV